MFTGTFIRTRTIIQILVMLISFMGFNEVVLTVLYRNNIHLGNPDNQKIKVEQNMHKSLTIGYDNSSDVAPLPCDPKNIYLNKPLLRMIDSILTETDGDTGTAGQEKPADFIPGIDGVCTYEAMHF